MDRSRRRIAGPGAVGAALKQDGVNSPAPDSSLSISNKMLGVKGKERNVFSESFSDAGAKTGVDKLILLAAQRGFHDELWIRRCKVSRVCLTEWERKCTRHRSESQIYDSTPAPTTGESNKRAQAGGSMQTGGSKRGGRRKQ